MSVRLRALPFLFALILLAPAAAYAQIDARMFRFPDVSATQIAFVYAGDIWISPKAGGTAVRLSSPRGEESFLDNNGNGLVDEGRLVLRRNPGAASEQVTVLLTGVAEFLEGEIGGNLIDDNGNGLVDEPGFCLVVGGQITAHLTLLRPGPDGRVLARTMETSVAPRN